MRRAVITLSVLGVAAGLSACQQIEEATKTVTGRGEQTVTLEVADREPYGQHLTDDEGRALYMFMADENGQRTSACYAACADAWPPLTTKVEPSIVGGGDKDKVSTFQRQDGKTQVTYAGWPLYYFARDKRRGEVKGQDIKGFGAEWYLVSPTGEAIRDEPESSGSAY